MTGSCSFPLSDSEHGNQVCVCHAQVAAVSGPFPEVPAGFVPGCVSVPEIEDECRLRLPFQVWTQVACRSQGLQVHVGAPAGQVRGRPRCTSMQRQAQVALSGSHPVCVPQPRTSGACRCPGRSGESAVLLLMCPTFLDQALQRKSTSTFSRPCRRRCGKRSKD